MSFIDPNTFFAPLFESYPRDDRAYESSSSEEDDEDDEELITSTRLLGAAKKSKETVSRWYQLADQSDDEDVIDFYDRLVQTSRKELDEAQLETKNVIKDQERRMRQRSQFFETYSDDEDDTRFIISHKKRRIDEMNNIIEDVEFQKQDKTWVKVADDIKELENKVIKKMLKMKQDFQRPPKKYIKFMIDLRNETAELCKNKSYLAELPLPQRKALPKLLASLRNSTYLKQFSDMVDEYVKDPENYNVEENFGLEEEEEALNRAKEKLLQEDRAGAKTDSGPSKWLLSDASSSEESSDDEGRGKWLDETSSEEDEEGVRKESKRRGQGYKKKRRDEKDEAEEEHFHMDDAEIEDKVGEFRTTRGKRLLSNQEVVEQLTLYYKYAKSDEVIIQVLTELISTIYEKYSSSDVVMPLEEWAQTCQYFSRVLKIIVSHPEIKFLEAKGDTNEKKKGVIPISGNACGLVEQLDSQYYKGLKYGDAHTKEYLSRLQHQAELLNVLVRTLLFYQSQNSYENTGRIAFRILSQIYYRRLSHHSKILEAHRARIAPEDAPSTEVILPDLSKTIENLCRIIFQTMTEDVVHKSVLMQVYHISLLDQYAQARDLLMMSGIPDLISSNKEGDKSLVLDGDLQVLFNRVIAQLGLCAFRSGLIKETFYTLRDLFSVPNLLRGLIGQSVRFSKDLQKQEMDKRGREELEKREKERFIPHHMHINIEAVEVSFFISTMLVEIPPMQQQSLDITKKRYQSQSAKKYFKKVEERNYVSPSENTKDKLYAATLALAEGDWVVCQNSLASLDIWSNFEKREDILHLLENNVKIESLRAYVFSNMKYYKSMGIERLAQMFSLQPPVVKATLFKMIAVDKLYAYIDEPTMTLRATKEEPSELQRLALFILDMCQSTQRERERETKKKA